MRAVALVVLALVAFVHADMYLHNPRGSNNRLDEARRERTNANRMFDSQNNNRGGYNVGSLYYYEGSILPIEWTNQHSCGDENNYCEQIIQYMCGDQVRDGSSTNTIPENPANCENFDCNSDLEYGMHENFDYYLNCKLRERNMGLFTADRNLQGVTAKYTRQNNNGQRRGYECPEERDYYPYWHPTPWRDVAILTNNVMRCRQYQRDSQNVQSRFACVLPNGYIAENFNLNRNRYAIPITKEDCEERFYDDGSVNGTYGVWTEFTPDGRLEAPECVEAQWSRDNHLGNTVGGFPIYYNWTIPNLPDEHCVLRIRYNISTGDYEAWDSANSTIQQIRAQVYDGGNGLNNERISPISSVYEQFGFDFDEARERGYVFRQNPVVKVVPDTEAGNGFGLQLAINTNQFGRTFQDRSHTFAIRERPEELKDVTIYNLNVRGKRGNIVQTYPGVEYDFVPNSLVAALGDYVHIQWTGSNTNPNNNDGQGKAGTDRSNIVLLGTQNFHEGSVVVGKMGHWGNSYPAHLDHNETFMGWDRAMRQTLGTLDNVQLGGEMSELDDAGTYFDLGPRKVTQSGTYHYMCSRNNNFTNRSQKGKVTIQNNPLATGRIGWTGGSVNVKGHEISFKQGDLIKPNMIRMDIYTDEDEAMQEVMQAAGTDEVNIPGNTVSQFMSIYPHTTFDGAMSAATVTIPVDDNAASDRTTIYRASEQSGWEFEEMETEIVDGRAQTSSNTGGIFVAKSGVNYGLVVGVVIAGVVLLIVILAVIALAVYFVVRPEKWKSTKDKLHTTQMKMKRSFAKQV